MIDDDQSLLWIGAFRYWCGRMTIATPGFARMLVSNWPRLDERSRVVILRDLEREVQIDTEQRDAGKSEWRRLGQDCDRKTWVETLAALRQMERKCAKCGGDMRPGVALAQTYTGGAPDLGAVCTMSPGGPGKLVECSKCAACGWSVA